MNQSMDKSSEIIKFYRDGRIIFSVEDVMTNRLDKKLYKIGFKLIPLDANNQSIKENILTHYMDVIEVKRMIFHILMKDDISGLYNNKEQIKGREFACYKDLKGGTVDNEVRSRILTFFKFDNSYIFQLSIHPGRVHGKGAILPTAGPIHKLYIRLTKEEIEQFAIELRDYIQQKEILQFKKYYHVE